jgi:hypothetical protein
MFRHLLAPPKPRNSNASGGSVGDVNAASSPPAAAAGSSATVGASSRSGSNSHTHLAVSHHELSLTEKYGQAEKIIGKGAGGVVRLFHKLGATGPDDKLYAVKVYFIIRKKEDNFE